MNLIFVWIIILSFIFAAFGQLTQVAVEGQKLPMEALGQAIIDSSKASVTLALGLVGVMTFFLGLMKVAEAGGALKIISKLLYPAMVRLFPSVPKDHPAMGAIILNISANVLGLGNAATPFGIKAMQELNKLNSQKGVASDSMVLFLAINTSSVTLLPTGVVALRAAANSQDPAGIIPTTLFATVCSTIAAIFAAKFFAKLWRSSAPQEIDQRTQEEKTTGSASDFNGDDSYPGWVTATALLALLVFIPLTIAYGTVIAPWIIPVLTLGFVLFGWLRKVPVYETFVEGAKDGFDVALKIIPYLVAILVAVSMFRESGALQFIIDPLSKVTSLIGLPGEALPMALLRPLSGSGAYGILASIIENPLIGPDSYVGYLVSTFQGSTETTFYVLAVYFGAVQIKNIRHGLYAALIADFIGIAAAVFICLALYG